MQNLGIQYLRGFEGKKRSGYLIKGTLLEKMYLRGVHDRNNNLPNRYLKKKDEK